MRQLTRNERRVHAKRMEKLPTEFIEVPDHEWPAHMRDGRRRRVWKNRYWLVQEFEEGNGIIRLTVNSTNVAGSRWRDGMTWDQLQAIKDSLGYEMYDAVEIYPRKADVVNVANMRHLWVLPFPLEFAWRD